MNPTSTSVRSTLIAAALACGVSWSDAAFALQGGEDPALLPVLIDKRFGARGRHQLGLNFSTALAAKFVEGTGVTGSYGYNFSDLFGFELHGGFLLASEASIMDQVRCKFAAQEPPLSDLSQMQWMAGANITFVPVYGKMSFASEFDPSYDLMLLAGGGVAGTRRQVGISAGNAERGGCVPPANRTPETFENKVSPTFDFGLALRFYFNKLLGVRLELRDYFYPDPSESGITFNLQFQAGLQFTFGG